ncbi:MULTISPECIES: Cro/CI family transcriptional regulator [Xanthomonas]|uniref:Uncharacterized protein n=5 Tax=Xanthomonas TaxID=338 RepID=A0AAJ0N5Z6_9XANT|nr:MULTISPECIES: Cro/CI family transcriptional regulator [Xanthomonas]MEB1846174.1 Cro/CI family transcriptional regulator [Xanthomonas campestris pv. campestris]APO97759.1 hypothetical protein BJD13_00800 [Xanthomonas perforans]APP78115.1 hypothetical protein BJD12_22530 [Xanthomonas vesicatoria ATCC 35937]APP87297.1 hypothetical protein BI317_24865 [Xanthomonas hortorum pv. gardneri]EGD10774.1 hypothetical protein XVE_0829 [Xanthomonas vesicatoria ATCC 35937]
MLDKIKFGTENQTVYIGILKTKLGADIVVETTRKVLGLDATGPLPPTISPEVVSSIISELKKVPPKKFRKPTDTGPQRMTGRELLDLADLSKELPTGLDPDLLSVITRLRRLHLVQDTVSKSLIDRPIAVNGCSPIQVNHLIEVLGSSSEAAKALGVTIKTLEGWGDYLPESHESRAQLVTAGAVRARLPA